MLCVLGVDVDGSEDGDSQNVKDAEKMVILIQGARRLLAGRNRTKIGKESKPNSANRLGSCFIKFWRENSF